MSERPWLYIWQYLRSTWRTYIFKHKDTMDINRPPFFSAIKSELFGVQEWHYCATSWFSFTLLPCFTGKRGKLEDRWLVPDALGWSPLGCLSSVHWPSFWCGGWWGKHSVTLRQPSAAGRVALHCPPADKHCTRITQNYADTRGRPGLLFLTGLFRREMCSIPIWVITQLSFWK